MEAPCGRLLVKLVLHDLGKESEYKYLLQYKKSVFYFIKTDICQQKQQKQYSRAFPDSNNKTEQ